MAFLDDPLVASPPAEVPLKNPPLVRVIAQVRFPIVASLEQREAVAPFQESVRADYPILRQEQLLANLGGGSNQTVWRFSDQTQRWRVSLASDFLAIETTSYSSRSDFLARFHAMLDALSKHVCPAQIDRLGVRYINRIRSAYLDNIKNLVRSEFAGMLGTPAAHHVVYQVSDSQFRLSEGQLTARWGQLPAMTTFDPGALEAIDEPSWVLDLDMFSTEPAAFSPDATVGRAGEYAARIYAVFRWALTDECLREHGGDV